MKNEPADIYTNWSPIIRGVDKQTYGNLTLMMSPYVIKPHTLVKRVMINRAKPTDIDAFKRLVFNSRLCRMDGDAQVSWLIKHGHIDPAMFGEWDGESVKYLKVEPNNCLA